MTATAEPVCLPELVESPTADAGEASAAGGALAGPGELAAPAVRLWKERGTGRGLQLELLLPGDPVRRYAGVALRLAFPLSERQRMVVFYDRDGKEIGWLKDAQALDPTSREVLRQELELTYFLPRILRVHEVREELGVTRWQVTTDHGPRTFEIQTRQDIRFIPPSRVILRDVDGNRFDIADLGELDEESRAAVEAEL